MRVQFYGLLFACLAIHSVVAQEAFFKMRFYREFIHELLLTNLRTITHHTSNIQAKDIELSELGTTLYNIKLEFDLNENSSLQDIDVFFEDNMMLFETGALEMKGTALIIDPSSKAKERVEFFGPLSVFRVLIKPEEEMRDGSMYPRFTIQELSMELDGQNLQVSTYGDLPLYKSHAFESSIRNSLVKRVDKIAKDMIGKLEQTERKIWQNFPFEFKTAKGILKIMTSLGEQIGLHQEFLQMTFQSEVQGADQHDYHEHLRKNNPMFKGEKEFQKDLQLVVDENVINHIFMGLFYGQEEYSLRQTLKSLVPDFMKQMLTVAESFIQVNTLSYFFPKLAQEFPGGKQVDVRCGFSKQFMSDKFSDAQVTQITFHNGNKIKGFVGFGCGIYVNKGGFGQEIWENWRSFYFQARFDYTFELSHNDVMKRIGFKIVDGKFTLDHLKVFERDRELEHENHIYFQKMTESMEQLMNANPMQMPMFPYPKITECYGLTPNSPEVEIKEGYVVFAYNIDVKPADERCLFE